MVSILSHWAGPNLRSCFCLSHLPPPHVDHIHGVSSSWSMRLQHCATSVRAAYADPHGCQPLCCLLCWAETAMAEPCSQPALIWITEMFLTQDIFADQAYRASPQLQLKSWRGRMGRVGRNFSPLKKTCCVTLSCESVAASQTYHMGLQISQVEKLGPLPIAFLQSLKSPQSITARVVTPKSSWSEWSRLERKFLLKMLGDPSVIWQNMAKKQIHMWHLYPSTQRARKDHWSLDRGSGKEAQTQQFSLCTPELMSSAGAVCCAYNSGTIQFRT